MIPNLLLAITSDTVGCINGCVCNCRDKLSHNLGPTIIIGVISGIVASLCYAAIKRLFYPRIDIVPVMMYDSEKNKVAVKTINKTRNRLTDVEITLDFLDYNDANGNYQVKCLNTSRVFNPLMDKFVNDKNIANPPAAYALVTGFVVDFDPLQEQDDRDKFLLTIKATHPVSGTTICKTKEFKCNTDVIKRNCEFNSGNNSSFHAVRKEMSDN